MIKFSNTFFLLSLLVAVTANPLSRRQGGSLDDIPRGTDAPSTDGWKQYIHPKGRNDLCISAIPGDENYYSGQKVALTYCETSPAPIETNFQQWVISPTPNNLIQIPGHNVCLQSGNTTLDEDRFPHTVFEDGQAVWLGWCNLVEEGEKWVVEGDEIWIGNNDIKSLDDVGVLRDLEIRECSGDISQVRHD
ncbi:hypothetical protein I302_105304 [Kwoniella bestiolae CBS 10118]|uniref:Uncharacterized protein n=1 Tax=Kwoniella bestiolae CBS 10118 TaxID=1296100 RepID=A0A1B9FSS5_9TREE|nr:hypothetical protein I302_08592 [Kwoniella bestiolae CBS 10118]OCF21813.1 hypothetical protein I302_08592 [Kwoniella bestiolae CBS 10118]